MKGAAVQGFRADSSRWVRCAVELAREHRLALWSALRPLGPVAGPAERRRLRARVAEAYGAVGVRKTAEPDVKTDTSLQREHLARVHRRISDQPKLGEKSKVQTSPSPSPAKAESNSWSRTRENVLLRTKTAQDRLHWLSPTTETFSAKSMFVILGCFEILDSFRRKVHHRPIQS